MEVRNYYQMLNVGEAATDLEIKTSYRKLAQTYHPDKEGGDKRMFIALNEAYNTLSDRRQRADYDLLLKLHASAYNNHTNGSIHQEMEENTKPTSLSVIIISYLLGFIGYMMIYWGIIYLAELLHMPQFIAYLVIMYIAFRKIFK